MDNANTLRDLLRLVGVMAIGVGAAWALQVVGLGGSTAGGKLLWVIAAATIAGAGAGLLFTSISLQGSDNSANASYR